MSSDIFADIFADVLLWGEPDHKRARLTQGQEHDSLPSGGAGVGTEAADINGTESTETAKPEVDDALPWAKDIRNVFSEFRDARGDQLRSLRLASVCSGMGTHHFALKDSFNLITSQLLKANFPI
eukprot:2235501-Amphidinium_carterae.2